MMEDNLKEQKSIQEMVQQEATQRTKLMGQIEDLRKEVSSSSEDKKLLQGKLDGIQQEVARIQRLEENLVTVTSEKKALEDKCKKMEEQLKQKKSLEQDLVPSSSALTPSSASSLTAASLSQMSIVSAPKHLLSPDLADLMRRLDREAQQKMMLQEYMRELELELDRVRNQLPKNKLKPLIYFQAAMWILLIVFLSSLVIKKAQQQSSSPLLLLK